MGLDISFLRFKRNEYQRYNEDVQKWLDKKPKSASMSNDEFEKLSPEKQAKVEEEIGKWHETRPDTEDYGMEDIGYFRKVNFLVSFFGYEENCEDKEITIEEVTDLLERCREILKHNSKAKAQALLPTQSGFFFGSTDYDKWYFGDVKEVRDWCKGIIASVKDHPTEDYILLMNCWW